ncbi:MAG: S41 family peptidase [Rhodanobacteraceae bacterium]
MRFRLFPLVFLAVCATSTAAPPPSTPAMPAHGPATAPAAAPNKKDVIDLDDIRAFTAVFSLVKQAYVEDVDDHRLMQAAIHGLLAGLDPHSEYLDSKQLADLNEDTSGSYAGLGVEIAQMDGTLRVVAPIDGTPAQRAGIKPGDTIVSIDGKNVQSDDLDGAIDQLRGKTGTTIKLGIIHEGQTAPVDVVLTREIIRVASVHGRLLEPGYAYLRISQFQADSGNELARSIKRLQKANRAPLKGAVLDLRSNPGGLLTSAVEVSDDLLDSGVIVTTRGRLKESDLSFSATPGDLLGGAPLVVLVDNGTASAAEIVAGALKDNHRALLMGRRTFGKGSVQTVLPLDAEHAIKLTTARYYTPSGVSIQAEGIQPDIALANLALTRPDSPPTLGVSERDLHNHLKASEESDAASAASTFVPDKAVEQDYALNEALNVLKGLALRRQPVTKPARQASASAKG